jgi:hypothetical protein
MTCRWKAEFCDVHPTAVFASNPFPWLDFSRSSDIESFHSPAWIQKVHREHILTVLRRLEANDPVVEGDQIRWREAESAFLTRVLCPIMSNRFNIRALITHILPIRQVKDLALYERELIVLYTYNNHTGIVSVIQSYWVFDSRRSGSSLKSLQQLH